MPIYKLVSATSVGAAQHYDLQPGELLVWVGMQGDLKAARQRFAAIKAGKPAEKSPGIPLYVIESADAVNPKTGLTKGEKGACDAIIGDLISAFQRSRGAEGEKE